jgi:putative inorganic carbon (hco3(-)) transporter
MESRGFLERAAFYAAFGSALSVLVSIAASQTLLALSVLALFASRAPLRFPPLKLPLAIFFLLTLISLLASADPWEGWPQIRKFFLFFTLLVVSSTFRNLQEIRYLFYGWFGVAALASALAILQFGRKWEEAEVLGENFYEYYVGERISGFMSHWMTFGGHGMIVLFILAALLFFAPKLSRKVVALSSASGVFLCAGLLLGFTRSIWLGAAAGSVYLLWYWNRKLLLALPVLAVLLFWLGPDPVRARVISSFAPHGETDSNQHRVVCWRTGWQMIRAHPILGLGPEHVRIQFMDYLPPDITLPLPEGWYGHLHSIYIHYAAERGIPGLLALLWLLGKVFYDFAAHLRRLPPGRQEPKFVLHGGIAVLIGILVSGFFELNLGDSEVLAMFLVVVSAGYLARETGITRQHC